MYTVHTSIGARYAISFYTITGGCHLLYCKCRYVNVFADSTLLLIIINISGAIVAASLLSGCVTSLVIKFSGIEKDGIPGTII